MFSGLFRPPIMATVLGSKVKTYFWILKSSPRPCLPDSVHVRLDLSQDEWLGILVILRMLLYSLLRLRFNVKRKRRWGKNLVSLWNQIHRYRIMRQVFYSCTLDIFHDNSRKLGPITSRMRDQDFLCSQTDLWESSIYSVSNDSNWLTSVSKTTCTTRLSSRGTLLVALILVLKKSK